MLCVLPRSLTIRNEDREERNRRASYDVKAEGSTDCDDRFVTPSCHTLMNRNMMK